VCYVNKTQIRAQWSLPEWAVLTSKFHAPFPRTLILSYLQFSHWKSGVAQWIRWLRVGWTVRGWNEGRDRNFFFFQTIHTDFGGLLKLTFNSQPCSYPAVGRSRSEAGHWYQSSAEMKTEWSHTSAPTNCFNGMERKNFPTEIMHQTALRSYTLQWIKTVFLVMEATNVFVPFRLFERDFNPY
jgi:hypothetical protein